jgi:hypothetical protein
MKALPLSTAWKGRRFPSRVAPLVVVLWGLAGCQTSPPPATGRATPASRQPAAAMAGLPGAREYRVDPARSLLQILVYRGGPMARLGHNHVIASRNLTGSVFMGADPLQTRIDIGFPVNELIIDDPALREAAGPEFPAAVPQSARDGTRRNLLSPALLDGATHPIVRLQATDVLAVNDGYDVGVQITLKGQAHRVRVPVRFEQVTDGIVARGEFPLRQSELGLQPFSVAMGTLVVLDEMKVRFEIRAH